MRLSWSKLQLGDLSKFSSWVHTHTHTLKTTQTPLFSYLGGKEKENPVVHIFLCF